jgi:hypothetical protein
MVWKQVAIVALWIATAGVAVGQEPEARREVAAESYEVYSAMLTQHYGSWFKGKDPVLIHSYTALELQGHQGANCRERAAIVNVCAGSWGKAIVKVTTGGI